MYKSVPLKKNQSKKQKQMTPSPGVTFIKIIRIQVFFRKIIFLVGCMQSNLT